MRLGLKSLQPRQRKEKIRENNINTSFKFPSYRVAINTMSNSKTIFLFGGTSSLGLEFMRHVARRNNMKILSFVRPAEKQIQKLNRDSFISVSSLSPIFHTINYDGTDNDLNNKFLSAYYNEKESKCELINLSTCSFANIIKVAQMRNIPTFVIGSGAVVDWAAERLKINEYVEGKLRAEREASTTVHPGFYIKDTPNDKESLFPWHGLHLETYKWMFSEDFDASKDWGKKYYVTKISDMMEVICKWIDDPERYRGQFSIGSHRPLYRYEIRELSGLKVPKEIEDKFVPAPLDEIYKLDMEKTEKQFDISFSMSESAFQNAKEWTALHSKELDDYIQFKSFQ
jgi:hypothetical protein